MIDMSTMTQLDGAIFGEDQRCFGCGPNHPHGFRMRFTRSEDGVETRFTPSIDHQGAPNMMHGGLITTVADEVAAWALIASLGKFGFTTHMQARFARPLRIGQEAMARGRVTRSNRRMAYIDVVIAQNDAECFSATMSFILLNLQQAEEMIGPMPEAWKQFCR